MKKSSVGFRLYARLGKKPFHLSDMQRVTGVRYPSARVILHRLKSTLQAFPVHHGQYILLRPENWVQLQRLQVTHPPLFRLTRVLYQRFPTLSALVLYGSQATGRADKYSDFDVLLILPAPVQNTVIIQKELEKKLGIKLHLTVYSEKTFEILAITEPYLKFWLTEGIVFDETGVLSHALKGVAKLGYQEQIETAHHYVRLGQRESNPSRRASYYFTALKMLFMIDEALQLNYRYTLVRERLVGLLGEKSIQRIRKGKIVSSKILKRLRYECPIVLGRVRRRLARLGENEADVYWKDTLRRVHA